MRKVIKEIEVYKYEELSESAKEVAKKDYLNICRDTNSFSEMIEEYFKSEYGIGGLTPMYSLGYSQGDGFCFIGEISSSELFSNGFKEKMLKEFSEKEIEIIESALPSIKISHIGIHYHAKSIEIEIYANNIDCQELIENTKLQNRFEKWVKEWYYNECNQWESAGYDYFYEVTDEEMIESSELNDWEYLENGELF